jgi:hypothetical protein
MAQIKRFGVVQTAKFFAIIYLIIGMLAIVPMFLMTLIMGLATGGAEGGIVGLFGGVFLLFMPIVYALAGFVFVALGCLIYNLVAKWVGGIEIELE